MSAGALRELSLAGALSALTLLGAAACHTPLTYSLRAESGVTDQQLRSLRYYLCKEITLARDVTDSDARVDGTHALTIRNGRRIDYVVFRAGTVGTVVAAGENWVDVKFERGKRKLRFIAPRKPTAANEVVTFQSGASVVAGEPWDLYRLAATDWDYGPMEMPWGLTETGWHGTIQYGDQEYEAIEDSASACLELDSSSMQTSRKTKRFVSGLDVTQRDDEDEDESQTRARKRRRKAPSRPAAAEDAPTPD